MTTLSLGIIGNCTISALIDPKARISWMCLPTFDGDPVFNSLVNGEAPERGFFDVVLEGCTHSAQHYLRNTPMLVTRLEAADGAAIEITDFCPRYKQFERYFRPASVIRLVRRLAGTPRVRVRLRPTFNYGSVAPSITRGSNHARFVGPTETLRLTTNGTISYILEETTFILDYDLILVLGPDETLTSSVEETFRVSHGATHSYWRDWTRSLNIPFEWQEAVIRAAITLKLSNYEETGGLVAAMTTSIPEAPGTTRNWDYRYCWLRDSYFTIHALNRLSATRTMERYLDYIRNIITQVDGKLRPLYTLTRREYVPETDMPALSGYRGMGPVRVGNQADIQIQNDVYGALILASTHSFFDSRLKRPSDPEFFNELEPLGREAIKRFTEPDAGIWEFRTRTAIHTFSALMCWAAADRLAKIAHALHLPERALDWRSEADRMHAEICKRAYNVKLQSFVSTFEGADVDASLLLIHALGFLPAKDSRFVSTVTLIETKLRRGNHLLRYDNADDFGLPRTAFTVCTFWFIEALAEIGREEEARAMFEALLELRSPLGLLSEDIDIETGELWGNYPQTYSMVGLILSAMRLSKSWEEAS